MNPQFTFPPHPQIIAINFVTYLKIIIISTLKYYDSHVWFTVYSTLIRTRTSDLAGAFQPDWWSSNVTN